MKFAPILTEKTMKDAKNGFYTFWVDRFLTKNMISKLISKIFGVHVTSVRTINYKGGVKRNYKGKKETVKAGKKAIVALGDKEKIDLFEEKK